MIRPAKQFTVDRLNVKIYESRNQLGRSAAHDVATRIKELTGRQDDVRMIFAAAPSQDDVLQALKDKQNIPWDRITAFHMDEYLGIGCDHEQSFRTYLKQQIFTHVSPAVVHLINSEAADSEQECRRYAGLLEEAPIDIVILGIGENCHIAFNDPPVADFNDPDLVKIVKLDKACRRQQVHDGCFPDLKAVPTHAITLTIPALVNCPHLFCVVPGPTKAEAVHRTLTEEISAECPATILREHPDTILYLDKNSASEILQERTP